MLGVELGAKRLGLLHQLVPAATVIVAFINPESPGAAFLSRDLQSAAQILGLQVQTLHAVTEKEFEPAFAMVQQLKTAALMIGADPFFNSQAKQLDKLAVQHAIPAIFQTREFAAAAASQVMAAACLIPIARQVLMLVGY
jgi:putative tryptophan/tyrosine transport system substrate-binding protein